MSVLLIAEMTTAGLALDATARTVTAVKALGEVTILCIGSSIAEAAEQAATIEGVAQVIMADDIALANRMAEPVTELVMTIANHYSHIVAPASSDAKNILPRVAALLDVMVISDVMVIESEDTFQRPIYAGNAIQTVQSSDAIKVLSIRTSLYAPAAVIHAGDISVEITALAVPTLPKVSTWLENKVEASAGPELSSVGASRAAVDSGYAPNDWQVGQTGKVVAPDLYIACGISGAIQHLAGMKDSKVIVAINTDPDAPIFQVADYGLVGDLFEVVPKLTEQLA